jgi:hypothetical protein
MSRPTVHTSQEGKQCILMTEVEAILLLFESHSILLQAIQRHIRRLSSNQTTWSLSTAQCTSSKSGQSDKLTVQYSILPEIQVGHKGIKKLINMWFLTYMKSHLSTKLWPIQSISPKPTDCKTHHLIHHCRSSDGLRCPYPCFDLSWFLS